MPRFGFKESECRYCHAPLYLAYRTFRGEGELRAYTAIICKDCRKQLEATFGGYVVLRKDVYA